MKKRNTRLLGFAGAVALLLVFWCLMPIFVPADTGSNQENLRFDSEGNLRMTTHDKKAGGAVRYKTLGWVLRRTKEGVGESVRLKLEAEGAPRPDPDRPGYVFTDFICTWDLIFAKIGAASTEWQEELYQNGGVVCLDAIMTVVENGKALGSMDAGGVLRGEVYTTAAGIMNARDWADPQALLTHYNKEVLFPALPGLFVPLMKEDYTDEVPFSYGQQECRIYNETRIQAMGRDHPQFDVTKGIPTGEQLFVSGTLQKYYYEGRLRHHYGVVSVPVEVTVSYTYPVETETGVSVGTFTSSFTYPVARRYSYYRMEQISLFVLRDAAVENGSFPVSPMELWDLCKLRVTLEQNRGSYMEIPACSVFISGGDLSAGGGVSASELLEAAKRAAEDVWVRNDALIIDGEVILDGSFVRQETRAMEAQEGKRLCEFSSEAVTVPHTKKNQTYESYAVAYYEEFSDKMREGQRVSRVNAVVVHTPVVCKGGITDDIAHNQQIRPTNHCSLVLGRSFAVGISTVGNHKEQPGYGKRDYETYVSLRQVRFPFEVYDGAVRIAAETWIDLPAEQKRLYLPVGVHEGDYRVFFRTVAKNADAKKGGKDCNEYLANRSMENYGALDALTVSVVGRMYDLAVTDIVDYPRWKSAFYDSFGKRKQFAYWVGGKNLEGQMLAARAAAGRLPVLSGDQPYNPNAGAVGLGYRVKLQVKTIGDMRGENDCIVFLPSYYHVAQDGTGRRAVRLYRKDDLTEVNKVLVLNASNRSFVSVSRRNVSDAVLRAQSVQVWDGEYQLSPDLLVVDAQTDLDAYIRQNGGRIRQRDPVFLRDGYLLVQFEIRSCREGHAHLSYSNLGNSEKGYCNMWRMQGFLYERTDNRGSSFVFVDGDCLLFDLRRSLHRDYESWGTH